MDKYLDGMKSETANHLRLERFENWFSPGDSWESTYQDQLLTDLSTNFKLVMDLDYRLQLFRERYTALILMYHAGWASLQLGKPVSSAAARHSPVVYSEWDPSVFSKVWQKGIRPNFERRYSHKDSQTFASYTRECTKRGKFWSELDWWSYSACCRWYDPLSGEEGCFECEDLKKSCRWCRKHDLGKLCLTCRKCSSAGSSTDMGVTWQSPSLEIRITSLFVLERDRKLLDILWLRHNFFLD